MTLTGTSPLPGVHDDLQKLQFQLSYIFENMSSYEPPVPKPPILDSSLDDLREDTAADTARTANEGLPGLRALKESVKRDLEVLDKFLADPKSASRPALSTNAPYLIAVWNEVLTAPQPVVTIWKTFVEQEDYSQPKRRDKGSSKPPGVKVDVVADDGRQWLRVNTIKNTRILAEFREIDSYMTDSDEESSLSESINDFPPTLAPAKFDNSVLRMGRSLLSAASIASKQRMQLDESATDNEPIKVTIRLSRLDPNPEDTSQHDARIAQTIQELKDMGIDVQFGELQAPPTAVRLPRRTLCPTSKINLDLSILIALISDLTHSPLPNNTEEADARFVPPESYIEWKRKRIDDSSNNEHQKRMPDSAQHSRALANQALQEMERGMLLELHDRLLSVLPPTSLSEIEFWTTSEARDRCLRIASKIGGADEKKRAQALFYPEDTTNYWHGSRFADQYIPLPPIHVFPSNAEEALDGGDTFSSSFFQVLERTSIHILSQETTTPASKPSSTGNSTPEDENTSPAVDGEIRRATVTKANPKLTAHTVQSMLQGAKRGWTTLTANKASVRAILKEIKALNGPLMGALAVGGDGDDAAFEEAAIWIVDPRSLAEGMRSDLPVPSST